MGKMRTSMLTLHQIWLKFWSDYYTYYVLLNVYNMKFPVKDSWYESNVWLTFCAGLTQTVWIRIFIFCLVPLSYFISSTSCFSYSMDVSRQEKRSGREGKLLCNCNSNYQIKTEGWDEKES